MSIAVTLREHSLIKRAALDRACTINHVELTSDHIYLIEEGSEKEHHITMLMNISDCYDYWLVWFNFRIRQLRILGRM